LDKFIVNSLEHAKLLTDPFKLKLLERFAGKPVTTKQVADQMGEKAPRLYRHVDALFDAGFLELVEEKPKRGTVERYYKTVAARFEVDPELFSTSPEGEGEGIDMMRGLIRDVESDLVHLLSLPESEMPDSSSTPIFMRLSVHGTDADIDRLRAKLDQWIEECEALSDSSENEDEGTTYSGLLAFYPQVEKNSE
jgi:DNA-binding transcriptional ArsR family regulator